MRGLEAGELLDLFEAGHDGSPIERALLLLAYALPEASPQERAAMPIGKRDARIARLRVRSLGPTVPLRARCGTCQAELEADVDLQALLTESGTVDEATEKEEPSRELSMRWAEHDVVYRLPTSRDLQLDDRQAGNEDNGGRSLLARCITSVDGAPPERIDDALAEAVAAAVRDADPWIEVELALHCDQCGARTPRLLDVVDLFWQELQARAWRLLDEIHTLAAAYGWSEDRILALSPFRRALYVSMAAP